MESIQHIKNALNSHPVRIIEPGGRAQASVALILEEQPAGLNILFIERSANENDCWSGQIGFPGGRAEYGDSNLKHTAERETREELGFDLSTAQYLGRLSDIAPGSLQIVVSCFVYAVTLNPVMQLDYHEIADAFWIPIREFNNPSRRSHVQFSVRDRLRKFPALILTEGNKQPLWGLTYRLLRNLNKLINKTIEPGRCQYKEELQ